jgi:hypothetical protein
LAIATRTITSRSLSVSGYRQAAPELGLAGCQAQAGTFIEQPDDLAVDGVDLGAKGIEFFGHRAL